MIGYGLPWWLPEDYLPVAPTLALGDQELGVAGVCPICSHQRGEGTDRAHIVRKGMGGRSGPTGPTVHLCRVHHEYLDRHYEVTMAVRAKDLQVCWLSLDRSSGRVSSRPLGGVMARGVEPEAEQA